MIHNYSKPFKSPGRPRPVIWAVALGMLLMFACLTTGGHGQSKTRSLTLKNNSDRTINEFYMSHTGYQFWGANQLGATPLQPGQTFRRGDVSDGAYDFKYIDGSGRSCIHLKVRIVNDLVIEETNESLAKCESDTRP